ncbi:sugar-binding domain-containing protein [Mucilaginibacter sp. R-33]|uniref:glycoside hydrolase family 2 protein n=1 Tax=Mucilaginibacter sp. R-33 TaxID=3416711 RepID=UPI003CF06B42
MRHQQKKWLLVAALCFEFSISGLAQEVWTIQSTVLKTRWAKDVKPDKPLNNYPRPQLRRKNWTNLNGLWNYAITDSINKPDSYEGQILVPYPLESALSGVKKTLLPTQRLWYKRNIDKPKIKTDERVLLHFGAVDYRCQVVLNGRDVGGHEGGYTAFSLDITDALKDGTNELLVKVYDPTNQGYGPHGKQVLNPENIYYTPTSGIWQTAWLETVPAAYVSGLKITPDVDRSLVNIEVRSAGDALVEITVAGKRVKGRSNTVITVQVKNARLWSPDDPYLYDLAIHLGKDEVKSYFGMRKVEIKKDAKGFDRIFLNNKYTYNLGTLDQGFWPDGLYTAPTDEALAFDIKAIKAMGFNTIRKHIKIEPARWYYHADKVGVLVWQDFVNPNQGLPTGAKQAFEQQAKETISQLYNYPCITTWVLFNERWGAYDQQRLTEWVKHQDPTRLVNGHSGELLYVNNQLRAPAEHPYISSDITDVHSYPEPMNAERQEGKARVLGEYGGVGVPVPFHQWDDLTGWGYVQVSADELKSKYTGMIKKMKSLEAEGLSGSIYTQPFDVEGEENGLMTYDREIIKIPVSNLRAIHSEMINLNSSGFNYDPAFFIAKDLDKSNTDDQYPVLLSEFNQGKRDTTFLRGLILMGVRKKDEVNVKRITDAYLTDFNNSYSKENLKFIQRITIRSTDAGFKLFKNESDKINKILGDYAAENFIMDMISKEEILPYMSDRMKNPDWKSINEKVITKYGELGRERLLMEKLIYYWGKAPQVDSLAKYYRGYFDLALYHSKVHINNVSWAIFEQINDPEILDYAIKVMQYDLEHFDKDNIEAYDTYANLLYKRGRKTEAIEWQEKAIRLSGNRPAFMETLNKMKNNEQTWPNP